MSITEKILLVLTVIFSWALAFFVKYIFENDFAWGASLWYISLCVVVWLLPISFLVFFAQKNYASFAAFTLGILGFLVIEQNLYVVVGLIFLVLAFAYWFSYVRYVQKNAIAFSIFHLFSGIGFFFTMLSIFGGLLSFYSPFAAQALQEPRIPEKFFDSVYEPVSTMVVGQLNEQIKNQVPNASSLQDSEKLKTLMSDPKVSQLPGTKTVLENTPNYKIPESALKEIQNINPELPTPEQLKPEVYRNINGTVARLATQYQSYIPFAFALSTFLLLKTIFAFLKYLLLGCAFVLIQLCVKAGWIKKVTQQVEVERISM